MRAIENGKKLKIDKWLFECSNSECVGNEKAFT